MRVCIVGAGVIGCATALELARRGADVRVVDRHGAVGHGSTSASCGIVRRFYAQPGMVALAHEGLQIWANWADHVGSIDDDLAELRQPGMLFIPPKMDEATEAIVASMRELGIAVDVLDPAEVVERFPFVDGASQFPPRAADDPSFLEPTGRTIEGAIFEHGAGFVVSPALATENLRRAAEVAGARFLLGRKVTGIDPGEEARFSLTLADGSSVAADVVLNAAGPWSSQLNRLAGVALPLQTRALQREVQVMHNPMFDAERGAGLPVIGDIDAGVYCRPEASGRELVVGSTDPTCDELEWVDDPDQHRTTVTARYQRQCLRLMGRVPRLALGPLRGVASLYDVTVQDWYPIADKTDRPGYYVCIGTSGSSFKTAPVLGQLMAQLILTCEEGQDTDQTPLQLKLERIGVSVDTRFLSRVRGRIDTSATVIG